MFYNILDTFDCNNVVATLTAGSLEEAKERAALYGYDLKYYIIEECEEI